MVKCHSRTFTAAGSILGAVALATFASAGLGDTKKNTVAPPKPHDRFVTVSEFIQAKRPAGTNVSIEGYFVTAMKSGKSSATCVLVDSTDKVISAKDAQVCARGGVRCLVTLGSKGKPRWVISRKGLLSLAMYTGTRQPATYLQDAPPKLRVQGLVGKQRATVSSVIKIEYQDENGEWRDFR